MRVKVGAVVWENIVSYLAKLERPLFYDPTVSFLFIYHYDTVFSGFALKMPLCSRFETPVCTVAEER